MISQNFQSALLVVVMLHIFIRAIDAEVDAPCAEPADCAMPSETCISGACDCNSAYYKDTTKPFGVTCKKKGLYKEICSETAPCKETLTCNSGICHCSSDTTFYHLDLEMCISQRSWGGECEPDLPADTIQCSYLENLICVAKNRKIVCGCPPNEYYNIDDRSCRPRSQYGDPCKPLGDWCEHGLSCIYDEDSNDFSCLDGL